jgi:putative membrane protein
MGMAEVVPGVSGGTIAFITGIYEELLLSIRAFGPGLIPVFRSQGVSGVWRAVHGSFLLALLAGMSIGIVAGIFGISWLIEHYTKGVWSFFFGLILASAWWVARSAGRWSWMDWVALLAAAILSYTITVASPASGTEALWFVLLSGVIAISAMILPGISGSFLLLLLGMYTYIIESVKGLLETRAQEHLLVVSVFAIGCLIGLAGASRILTWIFQHFRNVALAILTGFMIGSLNRLWPWKEVLSWRINSKGDHVPLVEKSILPQDYTGEPQYVLVIGSVLLGLALVFFLGRLSPDPEEEPEVHQDRV